MNKQFIRYVLLNAVGIEGIFLLLSSFVGLYYVENEFIPYIVCGVIFILIGIINIKNKPKSNVFYPKEGFVVVALSWIILSLFGALPIFLTREIPNYIDALFEIVSGFTTTGSTILSDVESLSHVSLFWRSFTHWIGGMGILVFVLAILPMAGGYAIHILKAESPGPNVGKLVSKMSTTAKILYAIYASLTVIEMISLIICKMPLFDSICLSLATAGTGGFGIVNDSFVSYSSSVQVVVTIFMILFGVNFNIYYYILIGKAKDVLKSEELKYYFSIILVSTLLITINTLSYNATLLDTLKHAFFQVGSIITTTGFSSFNFDIWPTFSKVILVTLMIFGAMAGSTGGGFKISRVIILLKDIKKNILYLLNPRRVYHVKFEGKRIDDDNLDSTKSYLSIYVLTLMVSVLLISLNGFDFTTSLTSVIATLNNIGPGLNIVGPMGNFADFNVFSKLIFIFDMLAGRLELIPIYVLLMSKIDIKKN